MARVMAACTRRDGVETRPVMIDVDASTDQLIHNVYSLLANGVNREVALTKKVDVVDGPGTEYVYRKAVDRETSVEIG